MEKLDESRRYKWSTPATNLLVSIWSHDMVQNRLKLSSRNQPIWESIARYMGRKGFNVTGLQCRTRIKNMLCSYYEAVRKKDESYIEPYFDLFHKVVSSRNPKKKGLPKSSSKGDSKSFEDDDGDDDEGGGDNNDDDCDGDAGVSSDASLDIEHKTAVTEQDYSIEYLDVNNQEVQVTTPLIDKETLTGLERIITKAIDAQTKVISQAVTLQSEIVERLLTSEREKLEAILTAEKESRKQLEERLDRLLARLESNQTIPQLYGTIN